MALRTKPQNNPWLYLSPRLCSFGQDNFDGAPVVVGEIHHYLKKVLHLREEAVATASQLMQETKYYVLGQVTGGDAGDEVQIQKVRCNPRRIGRGLITRNHQLFLSYGIETHNSQLFERYQEVKVIHCPCAGTVHGLRKKIFVKRPSTVHSGIGGSLT